MKIVAISGSLRQGSLNTALLGAARQHLGAKVEWQMADIAAIPLYNQDLDGDTKPAAVAQLQAQIAGADALIIATPEYNYGVPGPLKNALDWVSRPAYRSVLAHIPTLIMSASMSPVGGVRAQGQLKKVLAGTLTPLMPCPEFALGSAHECFTNGELTDQEAVKKLARLVSDFTDWVEAEVDFEL
jgi:chromate reductase